MEFNIIHIKPNASDIETWISVVDDLVVGHIHMKLESSNQIKFLDAWVHEDYRRMGIWRSLWDKRWDYVQSNYGGWKVYAWCKPQSLPLLIEKGFETGETCTYVEKLIPKSEI